MLWLLLGHCLGIVDTQLMLVFLILRMSLPLTRTLASIIESSLLRESLQSPLISGIIFMIPLPYLMDEHHEYIVLI